MVAVLVGDAGPGKVVETGPGQASEAAERAIQKIQIATPPSCILALEPQVHDINSHELPWFFLACYRKSLRWNGPVRGLWLDTCSLSCLRRPL